MEVLDQQNPTNRRLGNAGARVIAYLIDIVTVSIVLWPFAMMIGLTEAAFDFMRGDDGFSPRLQHFISRNILREMTFGAWVLYCIVAEASAWHGTLGKRIMGIEVVDEDGNPLDLGKSVVRNLSKWISYLVCLLGFFWVFFDRQNRGWHDIIAKTFVVERPR